LQGNNPVFLIWFSLWLAKLWLALSVILYMGMNN
jgi:hypothetical protein